jgi:polyisoprenoid-binding protein YceI
MSDDTARFVLGPEAATLLVKTGKAGAAAKAGHNLTIEVTAWEATLEVGAGHVPAAVTLTADARSLRVREGSGGIQGLDADDKANIDTTIDDEVLKGTTIAFRSSAIGEGDGGAVEVAGDLELNGKTHALTFTLGLGDDGSFTGRAVVKQSDWGMKPYSALFGTLKVTDDVEIVVDGQLKG